MSAVSSHRPTTRSSDEGSLRRLRASRLVAFTSSSTELADDFGGTLLQLLTKLFHFCIIALEQLCGPGSVGKFSATALFSVH
jgi:hypothetical protein